MAATAPATSMVSWTVDGVPYRGIARTTQLSGDTLPPNVLQAAEAWTCTVSDGPEALGTAEFTVQTALGGNVLLIVADDLGVDNIGFWFEAGAVPGHVPPPTPNIDRLAEQGITFNHAYSSVKCSPSRANLLTGRHGRRTGANSLVGPNSWYEVPTNEVTVAEVAQREGYATAALGKWHLSSLHSESQGGHPQASGFDRHAGPLGNLNVTQPGDYWNFRKLVDGQVTWVHDRYATTDTTDDAIAATRTMPEPWFIYVAYNAPHYPWHVPPAELTGLHTPPTTDRTKFDAAVMALDSEIGRLLSTIAAPMLDRTTVVFVSDNGTARPVITEPFDKEEGKFTPYEGGVHVPMVVRSPAVAQPGSRTDALVHLVDLLPSVAAITGAPLRDLAFDESTDPVTLDGHSWLRQLQDPTAPGARTVLYGEMLQPNGGGPYDIDVAFVVDPDHKLISWGETDDLFDMHQTPHDEGEPVAPTSMTPAEADAYTALWDHLDATVDQMAYDGPLTPVLP